MTAHDYLWQARRLKGKIAAGEEQLAVLQETITQINSITYTDIKSKSPRRDPLGDLIANTADEIIACEAALAANLKLLKEITMAIYNVADSEYRAVLRAYYIDELTWPEIAVKRGYKRQRIYDARDAALAMVVVPIPVWTILD